MDLIDEAARVGEEGAPAALATVIRTAGSTPRHPGAKMIVHGDARMTGTIGGGRIELEVVEAAVAVAGGAPATRVTKHLVRDLAMCCGGEMELWIEPLDAARWKALSEAARRRAARRACLLVTALDGVGGGGKDVLDGDGGERAAWLDGERFFEAVRPADRLILFGAGHVAHAIAPLAARVGFEIVVCDEDDRFATADRFPGARILATFDDRDVEQELGALGGADYALIVTRDHAVDQAILERLLPRGALGYLGLIGSRGKLGRFRRRLEAKGIGDETAWARLRSPVGMDIGAETPEEIAVSVVAELIQVRRRGGAR